MNLIERLRTLQRAGKKGKRVPTVTDEVDMAAKSKPTKQELENMTGRTLKGYRDGERTDARQ